MNSLSSNWLIAAKLLPPQPMVSLIERPELLARLEGALQCRLTLVESPAGYGKTTLLAQWASAMKQAGVKVGWLSLEEDEADPLQFLSYVVSALAQAGVELGVLEHAAGQGFVDVQPKAALAALVNALSKIDSQVALVLNDYHRLQSPQVDSLIDNLLQHQPANFHLVIDTRERPRLAIASLRAQGHLLEISVDAMRFSASEGSQIFGGTLSALEIETLVEHTEGWAVALQLARLWLEEKRDRATLIEKFSGRISEIADYLAEQVLADLPQDLQSFLLKTSILERFDGNLANAVCGRDDAWEVLDRLDRLNCLLVPLDSERQWFRYHHLFADFLSDLLNRTQGSTVPDLHSAASRWFETQGQLREAVRHARLAGDLAAVARLIEDAGGWELILLGGIGTLRSLLRHMPEAEIYKFSRTALSRSYLHMKDGELGPARAIIDKLSIEADIFTSDGTPAGDKLARDALVIRSLLTGYEDKVLSNGGFEELLGEVARLPQDDYVGLGCMYSAYSIIALALGDMNKVINCATSAIKDMRHASSILGVNYGLFHLGQAYLHQGVLREAEAVFREALEVAENNFGADSGLKAIAEVLLSSLLYLKGDLQDAEENFEDSLTYVENYDGWVDIYVAGYLTGAGLKFTREGLVPTLVFLGRGERTARARGLQRLSDMMRAARLRYLVRGGALKEAEILAAEIAVDFKISAWREQPEIWRKHHADGAALVALHLEFGRWPEALGILDDLEAASRESGHCLNLIEALVLRALVVADTGKVEEAFTHLGEAFDYARGENIRQIFLDEGSRLEKLLRHMLRHGRETFLVSMTKNFISDLLTRFYKPRVDVGGNEGNVLLSPREVEVLAELSQGFSNKEIARSLDTTENTIKFHLKNIFVKLGVDKRTLAISVARRMNLLS